MTNIVLTPTIFHEDWWLNAATNGSYEVAEVSDNGRVVGRLPYCRTRRFGLSWSTMPELTHFLGPAVDEGEGTSSARFSARLEITRDLIRKLPPASFVKIKCHRGVGDVILFQEQKFRTTVQFTHVVHPAPVDVLWGNLYHEKPRSITKALKNHSFSTLDDPAAFMRFYQANLDAQKAKNTMNEATCLRVIEACLARQRGKIFAAFDTAKNLAAAVFCVWDAAVSYYLLTTRAPQSSSGAISAVIWQAMQDAAQRGLIFDFDGLANVGGVRFYADFGGTVEPRYVATKMAWPVRAADAALTIAGREKFFY